MDDIVSPVWPQDMNGGGDKDILEEVTIHKEASAVDFKHLMELIKCSDKGNWQQANLVKNWEHKQANAVRCLREELDNLSKQQQELELKKLAILEDRIDAEYDDDVVYWKQRALNLEKLLEKSVGREHVLEESIGNLERQSSPVEEMSRALEREDNFLHFVLQNAPVIIGHQDKELRYRFIYNHFPGLKEEDVIGKTDEEIFTGSGVKESQDFKREVLERGIPATREITFGTELFGSKTFLIYVEPVFSKAGDTMGVNYTGMDITAQVRKREKMAKLREEMVVQKTILDLSVVESGVTKLETTKFRPREVVKHVLQTAAASLQKLLTIEGHVADDVPVEVIGDVLRIRQILTNLVSNAIKFTHEGKVGINLYVVSEPTNVMKQDSQSSDSENTKEHQCMSDSHPEERIVWIRCDVYDTGIGIPEHVMPTLFKRYIHVDVDAARKNSGTGLGIAFCKKLIELMGGDLMVSSVEHNGSTFSFVLPYKVSDDLRDMDDEDLDAGVFLFQPCTFGSLSSS